MTPEPSFSLKFPLAWAVLLAIAAVALAATGVMAISAGQLRLPLGRIIEFAARPGAFYGAVSGVFALAIACGYGAQQLLQKWGAQRGG